VLRSGRGKVGEAAARALSVEARPVQHRNWRHVNLSGPSAFNGKPEEPFVNKLDYGLAAAGIALCIIFLILGLIEKGVIRFG